ncbi:MAG TPA: alkaline phosphatase family protein [Candidatus Saccharimonadales bacterium]|nr:alkaline phosphatase family protein [Candidatus Saccharimonadales bacterium]
MPNKSPTKRSKNKTRLAILTVLILLIGAGLACVYSKYSHRTNQAKNEHQTASAEAAIPNFAHIVVIVEENHGSDAILNNANASFINNLANQYAITTNYHAITRPSLPNYLYLTSGTSRGTKGDCNPPSSTCMVDAPNIADRLEQSNHTWKAYFESMPTSCDANAYKQSSLYDIEHNPFVYYKDILLNPKRCKQHVVPLTELNKDIKDVKTLPDFVFIVPNRCNDMHDCSVKTGDIWLSSMVTKLFDSPSFTTQDSLLAITWDEAEKGNSANTVPLILAGKSVKRVFKSSAKYNHGSLLHTIEEAWELKPLNDFDKNAPLLSEFFKS